MFSYFSSLKRGKLGKNRNMKKFALLVTSMMMAFSMVGCGGNINTTATNNDSDKQVAAEPTQDAQRGPVRAHAQCGGVPAPLSPRLQHRPAPGPGHGQPAAGAGGRPPARVREQGPSGHQAAEPAVGSLPWPRVGETWGGGGGSPPSQPQSRPPLAESTHSRLWPLWGCLCSAVIWGQEEKEQK